MTSLHESVSRRRAEEPAGLCCVMVGAPQPGLLVALWSGTNWILPWSHLVNARFTDPPGQLELAFTSHVVLAEGDNLGRVLDDLAGLRIGCLRDLPEDYRAQLGADAAFIRRLVVRPASRSENPTRNPEKAARDTEKPASPSDTG